MIDQITLDANIEKHTQSEKVIKKAVQKINKIAKSTKKTTHEHNIDKKESSKTSATMRTE